MCKTYVPKAKSSKSRRNNGHRRLRFKEACDVGLRAIARGSFGRSEWGDFFLLRRGEKASGGGSHRVGMCCNGGETAEGGARGEMPWKINQLDQSAHTG